MVKVLYTLSSKNNMFKDLNRSLKGLTNHIPKKDVIIVYTEPINKNEINNLKKLKYNVVESLNYSTKEYRYMEKLYQIKHVFENNIFDDDDLLFLDCDTVIYDNPLKLFKENYDFGARVDDSTLYFNFEKYMSLQENYIMYPMFNTGVMVFRNKSYLKIVTEAIKFFEENKEFSLTPKKYPDQLAIMFGLLIDNKPYHKINYLEKNEHAFRWMCESHNCIIYHGSRKKPFKKLLVKVCEWINYIR